MITVYGMSLSGNCHKVRMLLEHLDIPYEWREISTVAGDTRTPEFLQLNPTGKVPVVQLDDGRLLWESDALLQYLANGTPLWPRDRFEQAEVLKWMFFEQNMHEIAIAEARFILRFLPPDHPRQAELPAKHAKGHIVLSLMEQHLAHNDYFVGEQFSIADIALFAYTHVAEEGGFDMAGYPSVLAWTERMLEHPGITRMQP